MDIPPRDTQCFLKETENELQTSGVTFYIQFVGFVVVEKSLNSLSTERQTEVTREFIRLVVREAETSGDKVEQKEDGPQEEDLSVYLRGSVRVHNADVLMNVSTRNIILIDSFSSRVLHRFLIQDVSLLALGSEAEMPSFFCFVAKVFEKDGQVRKCFVFKATDRSVMLEVRDAICFCFRLSANNGREWAHNTLLPSSKPPTSDLFAQRAAFDVSGQQNLFGAHCPFSSSPPDIPPEVPPRPKRTMPLTVAGAVVPLSRFNEVTLGLEKCRWYHGKMTREEAESLVRDNGHFLVRKSPNNDEFILVGMNDGEQRHVCLLDDQGKIVTTVGEFKSISALIDYFHGKRKPLVLGTVELMLSKPINRLQ